MSKMKISVILSKSIDPTKDNNIIAGWDSPCPNCGEIIYIGVNEESAEAEEKTSELCKFTGKEHDCKNCEGAKENHQGKTFFHMGQSIRGAILNHNYSDWVNMAKFVTKQDGTKFTGQELKEKFVNLLCEGVEVILIASLCKDDECDEFCYKNGCQGHSKTPITKEDE